MDAEASATNLPQTVGSAADHQLRSTKRCVTAGKQWFLPEGYSAVDDVSKIPREDFTVSKAAVHTPRDCIPQEFFDCLHPPSAAPLKDKHNINTSESTSVAEVR